MLRYLDTVIKPEWLYTAETLDMIERGGLGGIKKKWRRNNHENSGLKSERWRDET